MGRVALAALAALLLATPAKGGTVVPIGACCRADGLCSETNEADCATLGGFYQGDGTSCTADCPPGACCQDDGTCVEIPGPDCTGAFQGIGTSCATDCPTGACCFDGGACQVISGPQCDVAGGEFQGVDSDCVDDCPAGACCRDDGLCSETSGPACDVLGGHFQGVGTSCVSDCPPGACCRDDGTCVEVPGPDCVGDFQGIGTSCTTACVPGACCVDPATCVDATQAECTALGGTFRGLDCTAVDCGSDDRGTSTEKGSLVIVSAVEVRWSGGPGPGPGSLLQDTFISLTNDYPADVLVQLYFVNGDPPLAADPATGERAHPGWNRVDNVITLTGDQPTYWSVLTGLPATGGVVPFTALDPGVPPGRPANDGTGDRVLRGFVLAWAVNASNEEIRWNHLKAEATVVDYGRGAAWEYGSVNYPVVDPNVAHGAPTGTPGALNLNGVEFAQSFEMLLLNFQAPGSSAFSGPRLVTSDTTLVLHPVSADLRQETEGPVTTKATIDVWNMNEVKFSGTHRCITCWDGTRLSAYGTPNNFALEHLQTAHGKARIDGKASQVCDVDVDPGDGPCGSHPDDVCSEAAALLGVSARLLSFDAGADHGASAANLVGMGLDPSAVIRWDVLPPPPEAQAPETPEQWLDWLERKIRTSTPTAR